MVGLREVMVWGLRVVTHLCCAPLLPELTGSYRFPEIDVILRGIMFRSGKMIELDCRYIMPNGR